ncbi:TRAFAC clade GTPase domain-containing protein [Amycolatopsis lurida]
MERVGIVVLAILAGAGVLIGYYLLAELAVGYFVWPAFLLLLPAAAAAGALAAAGTAVLTVSGPRGHRPVTVTPAMVSAGEIPLLVPRRGAVRRDHAWPAYLPGQAQVDLWAVAGKLVRLSRGGWYPVRRVAPLIRELHERVQLTLAVVGWPVAAVVLGGAFAWSAGVVLGGTALLVLVLVLLGALEALRLAVAGGARRLDAVVRSRLGGPAGCQECYRPVPLPWFRCSGPDCDRTHRDLRPGALGAWWRRCGCGQLLPTTVFRAARRLDHYCPACSADLRERAATIPEVRVPVIGAVSAGKTRLTFAALLELGDVEFDDEASRRVFDEGARIIRERAETSKTAAGHFPAAVTVRLRVRRGFGQLGEHAYLHLFDAAGEFYQDWDENAALSFLDNATGLVFVLDPFTVPAVLAETAGQEVLGRAHPATRDAEATYQLTVQRLRLFRVPIDRLPLAVAVVKADLLTEVAAAADLTPDGTAIRDWLAEAGLDNLVLAADRDFGAVRYFLVSSLEGWTPGHPLSAAAPLRWLMARRGLTPNEIPDEPEVR